MQGNYVKLFHPQVRDLGKRDGRGSVLGSPSLETSHRFSHPCQESWPLAGACSAGRLGGDARLPVVRLGVGQVHADYVAGAAGCAWSIRI